MLTDGEAFDEGAGLGDHAGVSVVDLGPGPDVDARRGLWLALCWLRTGWEHFTMTRWRDWSLGGFLSREWQFGLFPFAVGRLGNFKVVW